MTGWLLDTSVISELTKRKPQRNVIDFIAQQTLDTLFISTVTIAEIRYGIEIVADPARQARLNTWLNDEIRPMFDRRVLPISEDVMVRWRLLLEEGRKSRHTFSQPDLIIAATGLYYGLSVVTRNTFDFSRTRVELYNPWVNPD